MKFTSRMCLAVTLWQSHVPFLKGRSAVDKVKSVLRAVVEDKFRYEGIEVAQYNEHDVLADIAAAPPESLLAFLQGLDAYRRLVYACEDVSLLPIDA